MERIGTLAALYYDPLGEDKLSPGFHVPEWLVVAKRVNPTNEGFVNESEANVREFTVNHFKNAM